MNTKDFETFLSSRLSQLRNQKKVSARDMSLSIGQSENYINSVENKRILPSMTVFFYICEYLGIHPKDFFNDTVENPTLTQELTEKFSRLNAKQAQHILALIDDLLES